jgi:uncharacterized protein (TIGR03435 family)
MLQTLLDDRFKMTIRHEMRELPIYALVPGKNGSKLHANTSGEPEQANVRVSAAGLMQLSGVNFPVSKIADAMVGFLKRPVSDRTGIKGTFDFKLEWVPDAANMPSINGAKMEPTSDGPSIFTAVQEQLGLKLESARGPVEMLIIDRAEKAAEN